MPLSNRKIKEATLEIWLLGLNASSLNSHLEDSIESQNTTLESINQKSQGASVNRSFFSTGGD